MLNLQPAQAHLRDEIKDTDFKSLENNHSYTLLKDGNPVLCGGVTELWKERGLLWSFIGSDMSINEFVEAHYLVKYYLTLLEYRRLEMYVDVDFKAGHRWAKLLGFELEAERMKAFHPNGSASSMYARVVA